MRQALMLIVLLLSCSGARATDVSMRGIATLEASSTALNGEVSLRLEGVETIYDVRVNAVREGKITHLYSAGVMANDQELPMAFDLPYSHAYPGRYHLLLAIDFRDASHVARGLNMAIPYTYDAVGGSPRLPLLVIENRHLAWRDQDARGQLLGLDVTTNPHWQLLEPVSRGDERLALALLEGAQPQTGERYVQSAVLNWLGDDGFHYSRLIPWELQPGADQRPGGKIANLINTLQSPLVAAWVLLGAIAGLAALFIKTRYAPARLQPVFDGTALAAITLWLVSYTHPELWLVDTWPTGGDLASHVLYADRFTEWLSEGKITGWMPEVFAGFPAFRFYFPLPFAVIALLALVVPLQAAIKLGVMAPALLLPAAVYWMCGRFHWPSGARLLAALFTVAFLVHDGSAVWGGNLLAIFAGEFAYSWGLILLLGFWGSLAWALERGGSRWIAPTILLVLTGLSHGYPLLVAGFSALLAPLFTQRPLASLFTVLRVHATAFLLLGFWLIPLLEYIPYTIPNDSADWAKQFTTFMPHSMWPLLLAVPLIPLTMRQVKPRSASIWFLLLVALMASTGYFGAYALGLADIRLFPFTQLALVIACGGALGMFLQRWGGETANWSVAITGLLLIHYWLNGMTALQDRAKWNLEGYEAKAMWPHYRALADHLAGPNSAPRVLFEHAPANTDIGSTRAMEALPLFGSRPVLEGLYMEAAFTGPFIYQMQAEVSHQPSSPLARFPSVKGIAKDIADNLSLFYADTVVVRSAESASMLSEHPAFAAGHEIGPFMVFRLREAPQLVETAEFPVPVDKADWLERAYEYFILDKAPGHGPPGSGAEPPTPDRARIEILEFDDERLKFRTDRLGKQHLIKITYHPGWYSRGGETINLADPAFMMVIPENEVVELVFGATPGQSLGRYFSLAGILALLIPVFPSPRGRYQLHPRGIAVTTACLLAISAVAIFYHPSRHYQAGHALFQQGKFDQAAKEFGKAIPFREVRAQKAEVLFWTARTLELGENQAAAIRHYQQLIDEIPASYWAPESLYRLARLYEERGDIEQSAAYARRMTSTFPRNRWSDLWNLARPGGENKQ